MLSIRHVSLSLCCVAALARAQNSAPGPAPADINRLDKFVVSAGPDSKTSFDLAQGTTVLVGEELRRLAQSTLGETLSSTPGVNASSFGPGASRPVIRGLGGDRVRVLANGIGALDASSTSPDHNTALEPLFASRIEVLRGPSTLLYGSSAVGGAVNVIDDTISDTAGDGAAHGSLEVRAGGAADERAAVLSAGRGSPGFAFRVKALQQNAGDLRIPGVARIDAEAPARQPHATLPGSATETSSIAGGASAFGPAGHAGAALSRYETTYGVPTGDTPPTSIAMKQTRLDLAGEIAQPIGIFRGAKARMSFGDYTHAELSGGTTVNTTFKNRAWEGRLELPHAAIGPLRGTFGVQGARSDFSAAGDEVATPPSRTQSGAVFAVEEFKAGGKVTLEFGARLEGRSVRVGHVDPALPRVAGYAARSDQQRTFGGASTSAGLVFRPAKDWSIGAALAYTERLPTAPELFSHGPHGGTRAYEIGTTGLGPERSVGFDVSVRRRAGFVTGSVGVFVNRFGDYIFEQELPAGTIPPASNPDGLTPFQFVARDAHFAGAEADLVFHLFEADGRSVHLEVMADVVRARQTDDDMPLPRIPPRRYGARLSFGDGRWSADLEARHTEAQGRIASGETPTPGYTLVHASVAYTFAVGPVSYEFFVRGRNLTDAAAREHSSFLKELAPLPGRGVSAGVRLTF